ncbi:hypothetical protein ACJ73_08439, partial [Blastomyces percursus]
MASLPKNIHDSASQLFFQDKESPQYRASLVISRLPHPDRAILGCFIEDATDPQEAAQYFLRMTSPSDDSSASADAISHFLSTWKFLIEKFRPIEAHTLSTENRDIVYRRDGGSCCVTRMPFQTMTDRDAKFVHVVPPRLFENLQLSKGVSMPMDMLKAFMSEEYFKKISAMQSSQPEKLDNVWLLSMETFETMRTGTIFFKVQTWENQPEPALKQTYLVETNLFTPKPDNRTAIQTRSMTLENRIPQEASIVSEELLSLHARFSQSLAWVETMKYVGAQFDRVN